METCATPQKSILISMYSLLRISSYFLILTVRGWGTQTFINGDDGTFLAEAYRSGFGSVLRPLYGDLLFGQRLCFYLISLRPIDEAPKIMFISTIFITTCLAVLIEKVVRNATSLSGGFVFGLIFVALPPLNSNILGQFAPFHTTSLTVLLVLVLVREFPASSIGQSLLALFAFMVSISHPFSFALYLPLVLNILSPNFVFRKGEKRFYALLSLGICLQIFVQLSNSLYGFNAPSVREFFYALRWMTYSLMPPPIRGKSLSESSFSNDWLASAIMASLLVMIVFSIRCNKKNTKNNSRIRISMNMFLSALLLMIAEFLLSSVRYQHYLIIPTLLFWGGCFFLIYSNVSDNLFLSIVLPSIFCLIFLLGALQTMTLGENDHFYPLDDEYMNQREAFWVSTLDENRARCHDINNVGTVLLHTMPSHLMSIRVPCRVLGRNN